MQHCSIKKFLVMLSLTLSIICSVFYLCKKVGLCEEPTNIVFSPPPLYYGNNIANGGVTDSFLLSITDDAITRLGSNYNGQPVVVVRWTDGKFRVWFLSVNANGYFDAGSLPSDFTNYSLALAGFKWYSYNANGSYANTSGNAWNRSIDLSTVIDNGNYVIGSYVDFYPLYIYHPESIVFSDGTQVFSNSILPIGPSMHTKGGVLSNYISSLDEDEEDNIDTTVNGKRLPKVNITLPNGATTNDILIAILNGLGVLNNSLQGGVLTIGDYIGQLGQELKDIFIGQEEDYLSTWYDNFYTSPLYDISNIAHSTHGQLVELADASPPNSLSFTIPLFTVPMPNLETGGTDSVYLFGRSVTLDFGWYKDSRFGGHSIQDFVMNVFLPFLYIGMVLSLFFKFPSIIGGGSGFVQTVHNVTRSNNGSGVGGESYEHAWSRYLKYADKMH